MRRSIPRPVRYLAALIAAFVVALLGGATWATAAEAVSLDVGQQAPSVSCDTPAYDSLAKDAATERWPPLSGVGVSASPVRPSIDSRSHGAVAHLDAAAFVVYHDDCWVKPAQGATDSASPAAPESRAIRDLSPLQRSDVATKGASVVTRSFDEVASLRGATPTEISRLIPEGWVKSATKGSGGVRYANPERLGEQMRVMPGNPADPNILKQGPYLRISRNGTVSDPIPLDGNPGLR